MFLMIPVVPQSGDLFSKYRHRAQDAEVDELLNLRVIHSAGPKEPGSKFGTGGLCFELLVGVMTLTKHCQKSSQPELRT